MNIIANLNDALSVKINLDKTELMLRCLPLLNSDVIINGMIYEDQCIQISVCYNFFRLQSDSWQPYKQSYIAFQLDSQ